jgi:hypothetical protein
MSSNIQELYLSGSINKQHPCYSTFRNNIHIPVKNGFSTYKGRDKIVVQGILDTPTDPRFTCLRTVRTGLSDGNVVYVQYKNEPRQVESFEIVAPCKDDFCVYKRKIYMAGNSWNMETNKNMCMYTSDGDFICLGK